VRATCEQCAAVQPPSWTAGDLCTACGHSVRREARCFWCTTWTPAAAFCRTCGADVIDERLYGAARMLKDAGTDRFTVPERLFSLGDDRIENLTRIFQQHAVVAARHVDELHAVELHLHDRQWSGALDDGLAAELPWSPDVLERYTSRTAGPIGDGIPTLDVIRRVHDTTPFDGTRRVASLALMQLGDDSVLDEVRSALHGGQPAERAEAALVLSSWRVRTMHDAGELRGDVDALLTELERSPFRAAASVPVAALRGDPDLLPPADVLSGDQDALFDAALQRGDADRLVTAVDDHRDDPVAAIAAARALIWIDVIAPLERVLRDGDDVVRAEVLAAMDRSKRPCDEVHGALVDIAAQPATGPSLRRVAARIACRSMTHESAVRIARSLDGGGWDDAAIMQSLLQCELVGPDTVVDLADIMLERGTFSMQQYGLGTVADDGRMPATFAPARFDDADDATRRELLGLIERQLARVDGMSLDAELHRFVLRVVFGPQSSETRSAAMWALRRWYHSCGDIRSEGPFELRIDRIETVFGTLDAFVGGLSALLLDSEARHEIGIAEYLANLLGTADDQLIAALQRDRIGHRLVQALAVAVQQDDRTTTVQAMRGLLSRLDARERAELA